MRLYRAVIATPVGPMLALAGPDALCALEFQMDRRISRLGARLARYYPGVEVADGWNDMLGATRSWLDRYFDGAPVDHAALPLDARGTPFERSVWNALRLIPRGATVSYGEIARRIGQPTASRAVGLANGANPIAIIVPCHRVVGANGTLVGYGGGLDRKTWLLAHERPLGAHGVSPTRTRADRQTRTTHSGRLPFDS